MAPAFGRGCEMMRRERRDARRGQKDERSQECNLPEMLADAKADIQLMSSKIDLSHGMEEPCSGGVGF